jgi:hypothetical protein
VFAPNIKYGRVVGVHRMKIENFFSLNDRIYAQEDKRIYAQVTDVDVRNSKLIMRVEKLFKDRRSALTYDVRKDVLTKDRTVIKVDPIEADFMQGLLEIECEDLREKGFDTDITYKTYTAKFGADIEADISVCSGQTNFFINPVLYHNGREVALLEPSDNLLSEYEFEYGKVYTVVLEKVI